MKTGSRTKGTAPVAFSGRADHRAIGHASPLWTTSVSYVSCFRIIKRTVKALVEELCAKRKCQICFERARKCGAPHLLNLLRVLLLASGGDTGRRLATGNVAKKYSCQYIADMVN